MNCLNPISAYFNRGERTEKGKRVLSFSPSEISTLQVRNGEVLPDFFLPCGKCTLCLERRRKEWVRRLQLEAFDNPCTFLTLTYNDKNLRDCNKPDIQRFLKRFRQLSRKGLDLSNFKYFFVSEYGSKTHRPHYHAILFGVDMLRNPFFRSEIATHKKDSRGRVYPVYTSPVVSDLWTFGFNSVDRCTESRIRYVAKYVAKSLTDDGKSLFHLYSRRLGVRLFLDKDCSRLLPFAYSTLSSGRYLLSRDCPPVASPKFLDYYFSILDPLTLEAVKSKRRAFAVNFKQDVEIVRGRVFDILSKQQTVKRNEIL